jgi:hypothetical protein
MANVAGVEDDVFIFSGVFDNAGNSVRKVSSISRDICDPIATPVGKLSLNWS